MSPTIKAPSPNFKPSEDEIEAKQAATRDKITSIQEMVTRDTRMLGSVYGSGGVLTGSPLSLR